MKNRRSEYEKVASLGCIICKGLAEIHHLREGSGMGKKGERIIPLCHPHHRTGGYGVAVHAGKKAFEKNFGTQEELWQKTQQLIEANQLVRNLRG